MKLLLYLFVAFICMLMFEACEEFQTEIKGKEYFDAPQMSVVGYLTKYGAIVQIQKTIPCLSSKDNDTKLSNPIVKLIAENNAQNVTLYTQDGYLFATPDSFKPDSTIRYSLEVVADGFDKISSENIKIEKEVSLDKIEVKVSTHTYSNVDTALMSLIGTNRSITVKSELYKRDNVINNFSLKTLEYCNDQGSDLDALTSPNSRSFYFEIGFGGTTKPTEDTIRCIDFCSGQVQTGETFMYKGVEYEKTKKIDGIYVQAITYSDSLANFFNAAVEYAENRSEAFMITAEKIPSNMSNGIGYFGAVAMDITKVEIPKNVKDTTIVIK